MTDVASPEAEPTREALFRWGRGELRRAGVETAELDARVLLIEALGIDHATLIMSPRELVPAEVRQRFKGMITQRLQGVPVSRILGFREFYGHRLAVSDETLDPRPDTETVVERCLQIADLMGWDGGKRPDGEALKIIDLGTGSGAIILSLLHALPSAWGCGIDLSQDALGTAQANASTLRLSDRLSLACGNWADAFFGQVDVIVSNPPYIGTHDIAGLAPEVRIYDPAAALDGGPDGLDAYRRIVPSASRLLNPGGWLIVEIGASQAKDVVALFRMAGFVAHPAIPEIGHDLGGRDRVVSMQLAQMS